LSTIAAATGIQLSARAGLPALQVQLSDSAASAAAGARSAAVRTLAAGGVAVVEIARVTPGSEVRLVKLSDQHERQLEGPWPMTVRLPPGQYEVIASKAGHYAQMRQLRVAAGEPARRVLRMELAPL
jgi:hypothetical protein